MNSVDASGPWTGPLEWIYTGVLDRARVQKTNGSAINGWGLTQSDMYIVGSISWICYGNSVALYCCYC